MQSVCSSVVWLGCRASGTITSTQWVQCGQCGDWEGHGRTQFLRIWKAECAHAHILFDSDAFGPFGSDFFSDLVETFFCSPGLCLVAKDEHELQQLGYYEDERREFLAKKDDSCELHQLPPLRLAARQNHVEAAKEIARGPLAKRFRKPVATPCRLSPRTPRHIASNNPPMVDSCQLKIEPL
eukprot:Skav210521  [mRNA]  locus=scaffold3045:156804:157349:+ [translate_table: standard]